MKNVLNRLVARIDRAGLAWLSRNDPPPPPPSPDPAPADWFGAVFNNVEVLSAPAMDAAEGPCPACGSDHFFLRRRQGVKLRMPPGQGHYAGADNAVIMPPAPLCFACGYNGLYTQGPQLEEG